MSFLPPNQQRQSTEGFCQRQLGGNFRTDLATLPQLQGSKMAVRCGDTVGYRLRRPMLALQFL